MQPRPDRRSFLLAAASALAVPGAFAQGWPDKPVRMIVPLAPASTVDIVARKLGDALGARLGQPFVIDNKPGAGGVIGTGEMVRAAADGYTLGMISSNHVINPGVIKDIPFDSLADITAISVVATVPIVLVVHPSLGVDSVTALVAMAKAQPGQVDFGSAGNGTAIHLAGVLFTSEAGVDMPHVPYRGTGPLATDLVAGHVKVGFLSVAAALPHVQKGKLRALAISTRARSDQMPSVPTMAEAGLPNYAFDAWIALIGPKNLPAPIVARLHAETKAALGTDRMRQDFAAQGIAVVGSDPAAAASFFENELAKHEKLVAASGATAQ